MLKLLDLFSGIGGFSLGMEATNRIKTIAFVEKDKFCQKVLNKNFKNIPIEEDIRNVKGQRYTADIVSGGFPCQPFSVAGKRKGTDDDRYLWDETIRVVRECKPRWFIGENVEGIVNINNGLVLRQVQTDLEKEGFKVQCLIIPASGIGAWHQRKRVWIIANSERERLQRWRGEESNKNKDRLCENQKKKGNKIWSKSERCSGVSKNKNDISNSNSRLSIRENEEIQTRRNTINSSSKDVSNTKTIRGREPREFNKEKRFKKSNATQFNSCSKDVSNTNSRLRRGRGTEQESRTNQIWSFYSPKEKQTEQHIRSKAVGYNALLREEENLQHTNNQRLQKSYLSKKSNEKSRVISKRCDDNTKFKTWWQTQSELCGVPHGVSYELDKGRSNRIKALGNSIVPQIAYEIGKAIVDAENSSD